MRRQHGESDGKKSHWHHLKNWAQVILYLYIAITVVSKMSNAVPASCLLPSNTMVALRITFEVGETCPIKKGGKTIPWYFVVV